MMSTDRQVHKLARSLNSHITDDGVVWEFGNNMSLPSKGQILKIEDPQYNHRYWPDKVLKVTHIEQCNNIIRSCARVTLVVVK